jgi:predicted RNA binding protein YcfA (HicA-like mRNA interferase family)
MEATRAWRGIISPEKVNLGQRWPRQLNNLQKPGISDERPFGFEERSGKGSHRNYSHPLVAKVVTIAGRDGDDARRHLEKTVQEAINEVNQWRKATDT